MTEEELRAAFARHEPSTPPAGPVRAAIDRLVARRRRRRRGAAATGAALALLGVLGLGVPQLRTLGGQPVEVPLAAGHATPTGALNVLLLGLDVADGSRPPRADSVLIVHVPADRSRLYLISVPRDLRVAGGDKLNATFAAGAGRSDLRGGYAATRRAVTGLTGVRLDAGAVLTYPLLRTLTDAVGGVDLCLDRRIRSTHTGRVFPAGCQHLDGRASVDLLRQRYGLPAGGLDRDRNAQRWAAALLHRIDQRGVLTNPVLLNSLLREMGGGLVTETGRATLPQLLVPAATAARAEPVAISLPAGFAEGRPGGVALDRSAPAFFAALREDRLAAWTAANPRWVNPLD
ncbi:LCP family protein [Micromonospora siamensis]|uniref:Cell envelope-related function transcriptional attenuator common domain-containing protein n=1 Tax=Micromonospora siamensis TaxID=299152 RepID=A0A1C5GYM1_9ACTN|nr:LCP family protein [Micromonospora siamensis]SCG38848.1 cell envelope-related function transcriptional attenuator common domain-containing protein [Micromonospora siamensis]